MGRTQRAFRQQGRFHVISKAIEYRVSKQSHHVPVVVHRGLPIGLEVEGVDHVHVVEVDGRGLVGEVHGVAQRQVPDRERLKLGVARAHAALVLVIELAQARGHLAATGAGRGHDDEATRRLDVVVAAEAVVADDARDVGRVVRDDVVPVHADAERLEPALELFRRGLAAVVRDDDAADVQPAALECVDQAQGVVVVGDAEVAAALVALDIIRRDGDDDLRLVAHLHEHAHLAVGGEARQHARCVVVVKEFAAELQIQLAAEERDALADVFGLHG